jgi:radical SAM superfamily enzyme YgiQ (UPF0313 family)
VISEVKVLYESHGVRTLHMNDDTFVLDREWVLGFCDALQAEGLDIDWFCLGRINLMDRHLLTRMSDAGCIGIQYGVESGSESVLRRVGKQISLTQVHDVVRMSVDCIENVVCTFVWGFPFETMEDFFATIYLMGATVELGSVVKLSVLSPSPLSPIYLEYGHLLRFSDELASNFSWFTMEDAAPQVEREQAVAMILEHPDLFPGFYYFHTPEALRKHEILVSSGFV